MLVLRSGSSEVTLAWLRGGMRVLIKLSIHHRLIGTREAHETLRGDACTSRVGHGSRIRQTWADTTHTCSTSQSLLGDFFSHSRCCCCRWTTDGESRYHPRLSRPCGRILRVAGRISTPFGFPQELALLFPGSRIDVQGSCCCNGWRTSGGRAGPIKPRTGLPFPAILPQTTIASHASASCIPLTCSAWPAHSLLPK